MFQKGGQVIIIKLIKFQSLLNILTQWTAQSTQGIQDRNHSFLEGRSMSGIPPTTVLVIATQQTVEGTRYKVHMGQVQNYWPALICHETLSRSDVNMSPCKGHSSYKTQDIWRSPKQDVLIKYLQFFPISSRSNGICQPRVIIGNNTSQDS